MRDGGRSAWPAPTFICASFAPVDLQGATTQMQQLWNLFVFIVGKGQSTCCGCSRDTKGTIVLLHCGTGRTTAGPVPGRDGTGRGGVGAGEVEVRRG